MSFGDSIHQIRLIHVRILPKRWIIRGIVSYGIMDMPRTKGYHKLSCSTWSPMGDLNSGSLSFFLQTFPRLKQRDIIAQSLDKREVLNTTSSGSVLVELEVKG